MNLSKILTLVGVLSLGSVFAHSAHAEDKWVCTKDGAEAKVKGKSAKAQQKHCEKMGGKWEKAAAPSAGEQTSGSGGAW